MGSVAFNCAISSQHSLYMGWVWGGELLTLAQSGLSMGRKLLTSSVCALAQWKINSLDSDLVTLHICGIHRVACAHVCHMHAAHWGHTYGIDFLRVFGLQVLSIHDLPNTMLSKPTDVHKWCVQFASDGLSRLSVADHTAQSLRQIDRTSHNLYEYIWLLTSCLYYQSIISLFVGSYCFVTLHIPSVTFVPWKGVCAPYVFLT